MQQPIKYSHCSGKLLKLSVMGHQLSVKFFRMHFGLTHDNKLKADIDVGYSAITFFSEDKRYTYIYLKIAPNCLNKIGSGKGTYLM